MRKKLQAAWKKYKREKAMFRDVVHKEAVLANIRTLSVFSVVAAVFVGYMFVLSFSQPTLQQHHKVYLIGVILSPLIIVLTQIFRLHWRKGILPLVYFSIAVFFAYGIALGTYTDPGMQSTTFLVFLLFLPSLFMDLPHRMTVATLLAIGVFLFLADRTKTGAVRAADISDAIVFGMLSIISNYYLMRMKFSRSLMARRLRVLGVQDQLTGVNNRNSFESQLEYYQKKCRKSLSVVYVDVNGLHAMNDQHGHQMGDEMLCRVAEIMKNCFPSEHVYRIGGDEFVAFIPEKAEEVCRERIMAMNEQLEAKGWSAAVGMSFSLRESLNIHELVRQAEKEMYKAKAEYYSEAGHDRRRW